MPGSGPTDPEIIIKLIREGAGWLTNALLIDHSLAYLTIARNNTWDTTPRAGHYISGFTFGLLSTLPRVVDGLFTVNGTTYKLASVERDGALWADAVPA
jgi:hypothetical protein